MLVIWSDRWCTVYGTHAFMFDMKRTGKEIIWVNSGLSLIWRRFYSANSEADWTQGAKFAKAENLAVGEADNQVKKLESSLTGQFNLASIRLINLKTCKTNTKTFTFTIINKLYWTKIHNANINIKSYILTYSIFQTENLCILNRGDLKTVRGTPLRGTAG